MTKSLGQEALEAFGVFQDILLEDITSENKSIQENINDLKTCQKMLETVIVWIGEETHCYSILEGEPILRGERNQGDTSRGTVLKFTMDRFEVPTFTLDSFQIPESTGPTSEPLVPIVAAFVYAGSLCTITDDIENRFCCLYLKATEDDNTVCFYFCRDGVTFQGTLHNIGQKDMARSIEGLTNQIRYSIMGAVFTNIHDYSSTNTGVEEPEYHLDHFLHDSPGLIFELESISIQFTPELSRACELAEANNPKVNSIQFN